MFAAVAADVAVVAAAAAVHAAVSDDPSSLFTLTSHKMMFHSFDLM